MSKKNTIQYQVVLQGAIRAIILNKVRSGAYDPRHPDTFRYIEHREDTADRILEGKPVFIGMVSENEKFVRIYEAIFAVHHQELYVHLRHMNNEPNRTGDMYGEIAFDKIIELEIEARKNYPDIWFKL